jgi:hypothetical protein
MDNDGLQVAERAEEERGGEAIKPGDLVICGVNGDRGRVVRTHTKLVWTDEPEMKVHEETVLTCELPEWSTEWEYDVDEVTPVEIAPTGTNNANCSIRVGDVIQLEETGLLARVESVTLKTKGTHDGVKQYLAFSVVIEPGQRMVLWDTEVDI